MVPPYTTKSSQPSDSSTLSPGNLYLCQPSSVILLFRDFCRLFPILLPNSFSYSNPFCFHCKTEFSFEPTLLSLSSFFLSAHTQGHRYLQDLVMWMYFKTVLTNNFLMSNRQCTNNKIIVYWLHHLEKNVPVLVQFFQHSIVFFVVVFSYTNLITSVHWFYVLFKYFIYWTTQL